MMFKTTWVPRTHVMVQAAGKANDILPFITYELEQRGLAAVI